MSLLSATNLAKRHYSTLPAIKLPWLRYGPFLQCLFRYLDVWHSSSALNEMIIPGMVGSRAAVVLLNGFEMSSRHAQLMPQATLDRNLQLFSFSFSSMPCLGLPLQGLWHTFCLGHWFFRLSLSFLLMMPYQLLLGMWFQQSFVGLF